MPRLLSLLLVLAVACVAPPAWGRASKKKAKPRPPPAPVAAPPAPVQVPIAVEPLVSTRPDGLRVLHFPWEGPAVLVRLALNLDGARPAHVSAGGQVVVGAGALGTGAGKALTQNGALPSVSTWDHALVLGVDTLRERWKEDTGLFLDAVSRPALEDGALAPAAFAASHVGTPSNLDTVFAAVTRRVMDVSPSLVPAEVSAELVNRDVAVWNVEETWDADRMVLVVVGQIPPAELAALVDEHFLIPASVPGDPPPVPAPHRPVHEDEPGPLPGHVAFGAYARAIPPEDAVVLAELIRLRLQEDGPVAGVCDARYVPSAQEPFLLAACTGVRGSALDVRETMGRHFDITSAPPTSAELALARRLAVRRLTSQHAVPRLMAQRLVAWAMMGLNGAGPLETSVAATPDERLLQSWQTLLAPERFIRVHRKARTE